MDNSAPDAAVSKKSSIQVLALPVAFAILLAAFGALPQVRESPMQLASFLGAAGALCIWAIALLISAMRAGRDLTTKFVLRRPHWVQPIVQGSIYVYWGMHWPLVAHSVPLILAQIVFAYAFDMLLGWSLSDEYELGFGPCPIILSMNLFMWFKPDWFYWQFVMVAIGFAAKRLIRWQKDGRLAHIFNPSSLPLAIISLGLLLTGTTNHTWGQEIAITVAAPQHIFEFLFLIAVPGQIMFGVATMTMPAVMTAFILGEIYFRLTGSYYFFAQIPTAAFLGMLLLFTDPSTAPKSEMGRVIYGILYGASVFVLYGFLDLFQLPLFYDKLLFVPFLNLSVQAIDRFAASARMARFDVARLAPQLTGRARNAAITGLWAASFVLMFAFHAVGDIHPGNRLPFWMKACAENRRNGCRNQATMEKDLCAQGSAWACNEYGIAITPPPRGVHELLVTSVEEAQSRFATACTHGLRSGCANGNLLRSGADSSRMVHELPAPTEYQLLIDNRGLPEARTTLQEWQWACEQGWVSACGLAASVSQRSDGQKTKFESACKMGDRGACHALGEMYRRGDGVPRNDQRAAACILGSAEGCVE